MVVVEVLELKIVEIVEDKVIMNVQSVMGVVIIVAMNVVDTDHTLVDIVMVMVKKIVVNTNIVLQE